MLGQSVETIEMALSFPTVPVSSALGPACVARDVVSAVTLSQLGLGNEDPPEFETIAELPDRGGQHCVEKAVFINEDGDAQEMSDSEVLEKFSSLTGFVLRGSQVESAYSLIQSLDELEDVGDLMDCLVV
jgi:hypothetical protein